MNKYLVTGNEYQHIIKAPNPDYARALFQIEHNDDIHNVEVIGMQTLREYASMF